MMFGTACDRKINVGVDDGRMAEKKGLFCIIDFARCRGTPGMEHDQAVCDELERGKFGCEISQLLFSLRQMKMG